MPQFPIDLGGNIVRTSNVLRNSVPTSLNTVSNLTYTAAQMLTGIIVRDPNGGARSDALDTAANLVAAMGAPMVGDTFDLLIINGADAAETITLAAGTGGSFDANNLQARTITQNISKLIKIRITNVSAGAQAYVVYM